MSPAAASSSRTAWPARLETLTLQAMCDGVMDACILIVYEARHRPAAIHHEPWLDYQRGKVVRGLAAFAKQPPDPARFDVGTITAACMLGYLDMRKQVDWRTEFPVLVPWLDQFRARHPEFDATTPPKSRIAASMGTAGQLIVDSLVANGIDRRVLRSGRKLSRAARRALRPARHRHRGVPTRGRRRLHGDRGCAADRPARRRLREPRAGRQQCGDRGPHRPAGRSAVHPDHRPGAGPQRPPRFVPGDRLPADVRLDSQMVRRGHRSGPHGGDDAAGDPDRDRRHARPGGDRGAGRCADGAPTRRRSARKRRSVPRRVRRYRDAAGLARGGGATLALCGRALDRPAGARRCHSWAVESAGRGFVPLAGSA